MEREGEGETSGGEEAIKSAGGLSRSINMLIKIHSRQVSLTGSTAVPLTGSCMVSSWLAVQQRKRGGQDTSEEFSKPAVYTLEPMDGIISVPYLMFVSECVAYISPSSIRTKL